MTADDIERQRQQELVAGHEHVRSVPQGFGRGIVGGPTETVQVTYCSDPGCSYNVKVNRKYDAMIMESVSG